jgi:hypothetical protein
MALAATVVLAGCRSPLGPQYEYEEQLYLSVDGAATLVLSSSAAALVALHGLPLDLAPSSRLDREDVRRVFERAGCTIDSVGQPWRRFGRPFVQIRIETADVRQLSRCGVLSWSSYVFERLPGDEGERLHYKQTVGAAAGGDPGRVNWTGKEIIGFKLHLPSRIEYHNVRSHETGEPGSAERGNILTWEQTLAARRQGTPVVMDVIMGTASILYQTLGLFAGAFAAAVAVLGGLIWLTVRRGRKRAASA